MEFIEATFEKALLMVVKRTNLQFGYIYQNKFVSLQQKYLKIWK